MPEPPPKVPFTDATLARPWRGGYFGVVTPSDPQKSLLMTLLRVLTPPAVTSWGTAVAWTLHPLALLRAFWIRVRGVDELAHSLGGAFAGLVVASAMQARGAAPARAVLAGLVVGSLLHLLVDRWLLAVALLSWARKQGGGGSTLQAHRQRGTVDLGELEVSAWGAPRGRTRAPRRCRGHRRAAGGRPAAGERAEGREGPGAPLPAAAHKGSTGGRWPRTRPAGRPGPARPAAPAGAHRGWATPGGCALR